MTKSPFPPPRAPNKKKGEAIVNHTVNKLEYILDRRDLNINDNLNSRDSNQNIKIT